MIDSKKLIAMVEKYEKLIYDTADYIWAHPETGFREWNTSAYMEKHFEELGYTLTKAGNIPGFYADLDTGKPGPKIAILGDCKKWNPMCAALPSTRSRWIRMLLYIMMMERSL